MRFGDNDIHIVAGGSAAGMLARCFRLSWKDMLVDWDDLSCGPLEPLATPARWENLRLGYWRSLHENPVHDSDGRNLLGSYLARLHQERARLDGADNVYVWLGPLLSEVLLLAFVLDTCARLGIDTGRFRLLDLSPIRTVLGAEPSIRSLDCEHLERIGPWRRLDEDAVVHLAGLWRAVTSPSPDGLIALRELVSTCPPVVQSAVSAFMRRYPEVKSGLPYWDRILLGHCADRQLKAARIVGQSMADALDGQDWPGDLWLFHRLKRMGNPALPYPLLRIHGTGHSMRRTEANLTDAGRAVLAGEENAIALNGIEDRIGGVTLSLTGGTLWLLDGDTLVPAGQPDIDAY